MVVFDVCEAVSFPPEGVVEVGLEAAGLGVVGDVLEGAGLAVGMLLVVPAVGGRGEDVAGRAAAVPVEGLKRKRRGLRKTER